MSKAVSEKQILEIDHTNFGYFRKAKLDGISITENELLRLMGLKVPQFNRFRYALNQFMKENENLFEFDVYESDVS